MDKLLKIVILMLFLPDYSQIFLIEPRMSVSGGFAEEKAKIVYPRLLLPIL
jgi:hypothetical protein